MRDYTTEDLEYELTSYVFTKVDAVSDVSSIENFINYLKEKE